MTLTVHLINEFKSFDADFDAQFDGTLNIISGVNGGGKSQLLDIIRKLKQPNNQPPIVSTIKLDGTVIHPSEVAYRSFKENLHITNFKSANPDLERETRSQIYQHYNTHLLDTANNTVSNFQKSTSTAKQILLRAFGADKYDQKKITNEDINNCGLLTGFIWRADDIFENRVSEIFYNYALEQHHIEAKAGREGKPLEDYVIQPPPWKELNILFERFNFNYRFLDNYTIQERGISLTHIPQLYYLSSSGELDFDFPRGLADLSDGEKAIFSLVFGSLSGVVKDYKSILLLDEFDATLNPSLTAILFEILEEYFIKNGVTVIIATHSPVTISLAPIETCFYEVFNKQQLKERIIPVARDSYSELEAAYKEFYKTISDQDARITTLVRQNEILSNIKPSEEKPTVYVEGPTDVKYLKLAYKLFDKEDDLKLFNLEIIGTETPKGTNKSNDVMLTRAGESWAQKPNVLKMKVMLLHDPENNVSERVVEEKVYIKKMPLNNDCQIKTGIENLFPNSLIDRMKLENQTWFTVVLVGSKDPKTSIISGNKTVAYEWINENADKEDFNRFKDVFNIIDSMLSSITE